PRRSCRVSPQTDRAGCRAPNRQPATPRPGPTLQLRLQARRRDCCANSRSGCGKLESWSPSHFLDVAVGHFVPERKPRIELGAMSDDDEYRRLPRVQLEQYRSYGLSRLAIQVAGRLIA